MEIIEIIGTTSAKWANGNKLHETLLLLINFRELIKLLLSNVRPTFCSSMLGFEMVWTLHILCSSYFNDKNIKP